MHQHQAGRVPASASALGAICVLQACALTSWSFSEAFGIARQATQAPASTHRNTPPHAARTRAALEADGASPSAVPGVPETSAPWGARPRAREDFQIWTTTPTPMRPLQQQRSLRSRPPVPSRPRARRARRGQRPLQQTVRSGGGSSSSGNRRRLGSASRMRAGLPWLAAGTHPVPAGQPVSMRARCSSMSLPACWRPRRSAPACSAAAAAAPAPAACRRRLRRRARSSSASGSSSGQAGRRQEGQGQAEGRRRCSLCLCQRRGA